MLPKIIGCEEFPKSEHGKLLVEDICNFINNNYRMNGSDVLKAFDLAATHSLFLDGKRVDPSTFGKFLSSSSVGKILTAYKESKQHDSARPKGYNPKQLNEAPVKKVTPEEAYSMILKWIREDGEFPLAAPYRQCYEYLLSKNAVNEIGASKKKSGRIGQTIGAVIESNPYRRSVEEYFNRVGVK